MSRKLDAKIAKALNKPVLERKCQGTGITHWTHDGDARWYELPHYSNSGNAMVELDEEMYKKGWFLIVERGVYGGPENFRAAYENRGTGNVLFAFASKEPLARALAAYKALTGEGYTFRIPGKYV